MSERLLQIVKGFVDREYVPPRPLLLGFSGGPDSTCLLYLLKECFRFSPLKLHVAHVDHGWREESLKEAEELKKRVEVLGFPFYLKKLCAPSSNANLEEKWRVERLRFFSSLYHSGDFQALLLGHQADDQAETVLKRVLEGASLLNLGGMAEVSRIEGMEVWRPLLRVSKEEILNWVRDRELPCVDDETNGDPSFLRGRMRSQLFPEMRRLFGKGVTLPLGQVGRSASELKGYLERKVAPYLKKVEVEEGEIRLNLQSYVPMESVELKTLLRIMCKKEGTRLSFDAVELLSKLLNSKSPKKKIANKTHEFHVHRGVLTIKSLVQ